MIVLHKLNGDEFVMNANHIELIESKPDTVLTLINEKKYIVKESTEEVLKLVLQYQKRVFFNKF